jgi:hypothetical protein
VLSCCCIYGAFRSTIFCNLRRWHHHGEVSESFAVIHGLVGAHGGRPWGRHWLGSRRRTTNCRARCGELAVTTFAGNPMSIRRPISGSTKPAMAVLLIGRSTWEFNRQRLCRCHFPRRSDRQLQYLAKRAQIPIPWANPIIFPKIDTRGADADLFGNFDNR